MNSLGRVRGFVYLIHCDGTDFYKIGIAQDVEERLKDLQAANPLKLRVLKTFPADAPQTEERRLHRFLSDHRVRGEWFRLTGDLLLFEWFKPEPKPSFEMIQHSFGFESQPWPLNDETLKGCLQSLNSIADGDYFDATTICKFYQRRFGKYWQMRSTKKYVGELQSSRNFRLYIIQRGRSGRALLHMDLAFDFLCWVSPETRNIAIKLASKA